MALDPMTDRAPRRPHGARSCHLCDWNNTKRHPGGHIPRGVTVISGHRVCAKHLRLLHAIAATAGVDTAPLPPLPPLEEVA